MSGNKSGAWGSAPAWGGTTPSVQPPSFKDLMKEQEHEKSLERVQYPISNKGTFGAWYPGKVNTNKSQFPEQNKNSEETSRDHGLQKADSPTRRVEACSSRTAKSGITVVNVHKPELKSLGFRDLADWIQRPDNVYIGRDMTRYVPGAVGSKWQNPFKSRKMGNEESCKRYKEYVQSDKTVQSDGKTLVDSLEELKGKNLGCWCHPDMCHGHVLRELVETFCP